MTRIEVHNRVSDFNSYRAARVKSLFNAENGCNFDLEIDADLSGEWGIGVVVGPVSYTHLTLPTICSV